VTVIEMPRPDETPGQRMWREALDKARADHDQQAQED
jgi:hypothetical protein